jgi:hypothetical protein
MFRYIILLLIAILHSSLSHRHAQKTTLDEKKNQEVLNAIDVIAKQCQSQTHFLFK